ncbi:MAG: SMP-30/gluconolactonase/LRE family protein, partial [Planctomycetota bacterium]
MVRRPFSPLRPSSLPLLAVALLTTGPAIGQDTDVYPTLGRVVVLDEAFGECLEPAAKIEVLGSGYQWCEGPAWDPRGGRLLFSEIPSNTIRVWEPRQAVRTLLKPSGYTGLTDYGNEPGSNGLLILTAPHSPQLLISCEHGDRRVSLMPLTEQGGKITLVDRFEGKRLNSPNDLCLSSDGTIYFTDPPYGLPGGLEGSNAELDFCGVYRLTSKSKTSLEYD